MDTEVAALLGGGSATVPSIEGLFVALAKMSDERAEETARKIADVIEKHLKAERERLQARLREATEAQERARQENAGIRDAERAVECGPVLEGFACPCCGERREDWLIVQDDDSFPCGCAASCTACRMTPDPTAGGGTIGPQTSIKEADR